MTTKEIETIIREGSIIGLRWQVNNRAEWIKGATTDLCGAKELSDRSAALTSKAFEIIELLRALEKLPPVAP